MPIYSPAIMVNLTFFSKIGDRFHIFSAHDAIFLLPHSYAIPIWYLYELLLTRRIGRLTIINNIIIVTTIIFIIIFMTCWYNYSIIIYYCEINEYR